MVSGVSAGTAGAPDAPLSVTDSVCTWSARMFGESTGGRDASGELGSEWDTGDSCRDSPVRVRARARCPCESGCGVRVSNTGDDGTDRGSDGDGDGPSKASFAWGEWGGDLACAAHVCCDTDGDVALDALCTDGVRTMSFWIRGRVTGAPSESSMPSPAPG